MGGTSSENRRDNKWYILVGKPERKKTFGIPRHWWKDDNTMDVK